MTDLGRRATRCPPGRRPPRRRGRWRRPRPLREAAGLAARRWTYPQKALTTILAHARDHREVSTEFHTREGPFTLVPLPGGRRSSLVWVSAEARAERRLERTRRRGARRGDRAAGAVDAGCDADRRPRGLVPMRGSSRCRARSARGWRLVGEAAHVFPPIAPRAEPRPARCRGAARRRGGGRARSRLGGGAGGLRPRPGPRCPVAHRAVDTLNRSLLTAFLPSDLARGAGLLALSTIAPLRRLVMREGVTPRLGTPSLMRG